MQVQDRQTIGACPGRATGIDMSEYNQDKLTADVVAAFEKTPDPRLREIMTALVKHVHAFAREVDLTPEEWLAGLQVPRPRPARSRPRSGPSSSCCPTRSACR